MEMAYTIYEVSSYKSDSYSGFANKKMLQNWANSMSKSHFFDRNRYLIREIFTNPSGV